MMEVHADAVKPRVLMCGGDALRTVTDKVPDDKSATEG